MLNIITIALLNLCLTSCSQPGAPIEYHHHTQQITTNDYIKHNSADPQTSAAIISKPLPHDNDYSDDSHTKSKNGIDNQTSKQKAATNPEPLEQDQHNKSNIKPEKVVNDKDPKTEKDQIIYYEVKYGETIDQIAIKCGCSVDTLAKLNRFSPPYELNEFQVIKVPSNPKATDNEDINLPAEPTPAPSVEAPKQNVKAVASPQFILPLNGKIISRFGDKTHYGTNRGVNIEAQYGTKIQSISDGTVVFSGHDPKFGNLVIVKLNQSNLDVAYAHLENITLTKGESVVQGQVIGKVGTTGNVAKPQLHIAIREGKVAVDPGKYIPVYQ